MGLAKDAIRAAKEVERMVDQASHRARNSGGGGSNFGSASESTSPVHDLFSSSSARSTSHIFPTSSSRGSESRKIIAPESVSHLIPDKIGGMYLDKQNNIWIRNKESKSSATSHTTGSDESEDDPFANIPDLTVDMTEEMQHLRRTPRGREGVSNNKDGASRHSSAQTHSLKSYTTLAAYEPLDPEVAARARGEIEKLDAQPGDSLKSAEETGSGLHVLKAKSSKDGLSSKRRNITISFTSPIASIILGVLPEDIEGLEDDPVPDGSSTSPQLQAAQFSSSKNVAQGSLRGLRVPSMNGTLSGAKFTPRPVSRIDEQDEESTVELPNQSRSQSRSLSRSLSQNQSQSERQLSFVGDNTQMSLKSLEGGPGLGFLLNQTPAHHLRADDSLLIGRNVGKLSLSPLSEFTLNNADRSFGLEVSYVMGHKRMATGDGSKKVLSMTIRDLVEKLSEAEPHEPYWEDMTSLTLHDKQLTSLHMLNEFCSKITTLDVSKNSLGHLDGVPECVRQLKVSNNMLTELTSWDHLIHLQYLDISNNEVKSLSALKRLIHLRSLKADNNLLTTLDGLDSHEGLLTLRARNNLIEELDFSGIKWDRLADLDVASNRIMSVQGLHLLPSLSQLDISDNQLQTLVFDKANKTLRKLDISDNDLETLDIRYLGNLQTLHADRNCISRISGFRHVRRMDSLSLREQRGEEPLELDFLISACEIRKLFLSGNYLGSFTLKADFLNLQMLELANCGLEVLPDECGQLMPNLRTLNINFNAIRDLSSLRFIPRLKKLLAAGNRLSDTMVVTELLTDFPHLTELDLRDNPITQGFYPPVQMLISADKIGSTDSFVMPDADVERDGSFTKRRDETTKLRRRLHEVVYVASCKRLRKLDGLAISREKTLTKDVLLQRLVDDGLVPEFEETLVAESESAQQKEVASPPLNTAREPTEEARERMSHGRWNAEDSFA
jgi:Leucine-rich repeat (LRR) protein